MNDQKGSSNHFLSVQINFSASMRHERRQASTTVSRHELWPHDTARCRDHWDPNSRDATMMRVGDFLYRRQPVLSSESSNIHVRLRIEICTCTFCLILSTTSAGSSNESSLRYMLMNCTLSALGVWLHPNFCKVETMTSFKTLIYNQTQYQRS